MKAPFVSVIIPAFNAETVLPSTLKSVRDQKWTDFEALIVDDGSTDRTAAVAQKYADEDSRFTVLLQNNAGVAAARNAAIKKAKGEWIAFLDADDIWFPEKIKTQLSAAETNPKTDFVFSNYFIWDGVNDLEQRYSSPRKLPSGDILFRLIFFNLFGISSVIMKRELLEKAGPFDQAMSPGEDWDMWLRIAENGFCPVGIFEPLLRYRVWDGNASRNTLRMAATNVRVLEKALGRQKNERLSAIYKKSVNTARSKLELASVRSFLESEPKKIPSGILKAWKHSPSNGKWLLWYLGVKCPAWLGGSKWRSAVYQRIAEKW